MLTTAEAIEDMRNVQRRMARVAERRASVEAQAEARRNDAELRYYHTRLRRIYHAATMPIEEGE